ncbi:hypothetical protein MCUN1_001771 [Malassezia cuniculi]|uniref:MI domain-containing protein n=1 Tax=Malassezia cuniculi TaxID=948313 RepID=A0AAF0ETG3_9BASI|nr:hypothetical protein MCUN1_001771 [Malassezia cuniculi]
MDLGTMQKKLKGGQYRDKDQFASDLNLIWDNCLIYNAAPQHPLRRNAQFMRKKANHLLEFVGEPQDIKDILSQMRNTPTPAPPDTAAPADVPRATSVASPRAQQAADEKPARPVDDVLTTPFGERAPLERAADATALFHAVDEQLGQAHDESWKSGFSRILHTPGIDPLAIALDERPSREWWRACGRDMFMRAALPAVPHAGRAPQKSLEDYASRIPARRAGIPRMMAHNIRTLQRLHNTHQKFFQLAEAVEMEMPLPAHLTYVSSDDEDQEPLPPPRRIAAEHEYPRLTLQCALQQMSWQVQVLLAHAGFNGGNATAVQVLTNIACEFLMGLGRSLAMYADRYATQMSPGEMVLHVLKDCGNLDIGRLNAYIHGDIERYGVRLKDWLRKLHTSYREQLENLGRGHAMEDDELLENDGAALALGHFAESIGDDYLGFKELGLDREFGLTSLSVPGRLFYGRRAEAQRDQPGTATKMLDTFEQPPAPPQISRASISIQIGLLRPWYIQQLDERGTPNEPADILPDEPPEKPRYKVPTSGKLPARQLVSTTTTAAKPPRQYMTLDKRTQPQSGAQQGSSAQPTGIPGKDAHATPVSMPRNGAAPAQGINFGTVDDKNAGLSSSPATQPRAGEHLQGGNPTAFGSVTAAPAVANKSVGFQQKGGKKLDFQKLFQGSPRPAPQARPMPAQGSVQNSQPNSPAAKPMQPGAPYGAWGASPMYPPMGYPVSPAGYHFVPQPWSPAPYDAQRSPAAGSPLAAHQGIASPNGADGHSPLATPEQARAALQPPRPGSATFFPGGAQAGYSMNAGARMFEPQKSRALRIVNPETHTEIDLAKVRQASSATSTPKAEPAKAEPVNAQAESRLKTQADFQQKVLRLKQEKEAREKAEREAKEKAEREAKEKAEKEAAEKEAAEKAAAEKAEQEAKEKAEREAKEKAEQEAKEKAEQEAKEKAEQEAKEKAEREAKEAAEKAAAEKAEQEAKEKAAAEKEASDKAAAEKEASDKAAAEKAAADKAAADKAAADKAAADKEAADKEASDKAATDKAAADKEAADKAAADKAADTDAGGESGDANADNENCEGADEKDPSAPGLATRALQHAATIDNISNITYPPSIQSPDAALNKDAQPGKYRYNREFLLQFMSVFTERPVDLPPLASVGMEATVVRSGRRGGGRDGRGGRTSDERFAASGSRGGYGGFNARSHPMSRGGSGGAIPSRETMGTGVPMGNRPRSNRGRQRDGRPRENPPEKGGPTIPLDQVVPLAFSENRWKPQSLEGDDKANHAILVERKVKSLLNKLTVEKFDSISEQIVEWANKSQDETDGRTLRQVIALVFEKAIDESAWSEMYAQLCAKIQTNLSPDIRDEVLDQKEQKEYRGGILFRKYLLTWCQSDFEKGWAAKSEDERSAEKEYELMSDEYYEAQKAKRRGLGLVQFVGELFKLQMLQPRIMHTCIVRLLRTTTEPEEDEIESVCRLLTTVGALLDTTVGNHKSRMDVYFKRIDDILQRPNLSSRMRFMLMDVVDLRANNWVPRHDTTAPKTIAEIHADAAKQAQQKEAERMQREMHSRRRGPPRERESHSSDGWSTVGSGGGSSLRAGRDAPGFGKGSERSGSRGPGNGPQGLFNRKGGSSAKGTDSPTATTNMFNLLNQGDAAPAEEPQRPKLQLKPRTKPIETQDEEEHEDEDEEAEPKASEEDIKRKIGNDVKEYLAIRDIEEGVQSIEALAPEHHAAFVDALIANVLDKKQQEVDDAVQLLNALVERNIVSQEALVAGFKDQVTILDDTSMDAPSAYSFMAILLVDSGLSKEQIETLADGMEGEGIKPPKDKLMAKVNDRLEA